MTRVAIKQLFTELNLLKQEVRLLRGKPSVDLAVLTAATHTTPSALNANAVPFVPCLQGLWEPEDVPRKKLHVPHIFCKAYMEDCPCQGRDQDSITAVVEHNMVSNRAGEVVPDVDTYSLLLPPRGLQMKVSH